MTDNDQVIAVCSVGNLGKYLCEELLADGRYKFVVISRQVSARLRPLKWLPAAYLPTRGQVKQSHFLRAA